MLNFFPDRFIEINTRRIFIHHHNRHAKQFSSKNWEQLVDEDRNKSLNVEKVTAKIEPDNTEGWLDFGAGPGYFTLPLAKNVQKVIAVDISEQMLNVCRRRAQEENLTNIEFV